MPVVDKYQPVEATPRSLTAPGAVLAGAWLLAVMISLASPATLRAQATYGGWSPWIASSLRSLASMAERTPFAAFRDAADGLAAPLERTSRLWRQIDTPDPGGSPVARSPEPPPSPQDLRTPAERWHAARPPPVRRILVVGASSIQYAVGTELERTLSESMDVVVRRKGKVSTGLTRPDVFDWPAEVARLVEDFRPDLVLGQFAGNDGQNIVDDQGAIHEVYSDGWSREYTGRIQALHATVVEAGAELALLGMPVMRSQKFDRKVRWMNDITRDAVQAVGGTYIDTYPLAATPKGAYRAEVTVAGRNGRMRMDDGIHFTRLGGQHMAAALLPELLVRFPIPFAPPDAPDTDGSRAPAPATLTPLTIPAGSGHDPARLLAFVPDPVPDGGLPLVVLLHGAWDGPEGFARHLAEDLAQLATDEQVAIAMPDGGPHGWWLDGHADPTHRGATWLRQTVLPWIAAHLPVDDDAPHALVGISMGGHGALLAALEQPSRWQAVASLSGVVDLRRAADQPHLVPLLGPVDEAPGPWMSRSALSLLQRDPRALGSTRLYLGIGEDDRHHPDNLALHRLLTDAGVDHTWAPRDGGHDWSYWRRALPPVLRWAIAPPPDAPPADSDTPPQAPAP